VLLFLTLAILISDFYPLTAVMIFMPALLNDDRAHIQTRVFLILPMDGYLTIFLTRPRDPFRSTRPARFPLPAVLGTRIVATLVAVFGL
jgi:H+-transporting ATPase